MEEQEEDIEIIIQQGEYYLAIRDFENALYYINKSLEFSPHDSYLQMQLGVIYKQQNELNLAQLHFQHAINFALTNGDRLFYKGVYNYYIKEKKEKSIEKLDESLIENPLNYRAYYYRGLSNFKIGYYDKAIENFNKAIELNEKDSESFCAIGIVFNKLKRYKEAIENFNFAIEISPSNITTYNNKGFAFSSQKQYENAIECFNIIISLNPNDPLAYYNKGIIYQCNKQYYEAIDCYSKVLMLDPNDLIALKYQSYCYQEFHADWVFKWKLHFNELIRIIFV